MVDEEVTSKQHVIYIKDDVIYEIIPKLVDHIKNLFLLRIAIYLFQLLFI